MPMGGGWTQTSAIPFGSIGDSCGEGEWYWTRFDIQNTVPLARFPSGVGLGATLRLDYNACSPPNSITPWCGCHLNPASPVKHASAFGVWSSAYEAIEPSGLLVTATPDTLDVGAEASLAVRLVDDHGYEVDTSEVDGFSDATPITLAAPADSTAGWGLVLGSAAPTGSVTTTYGAARGGAVRYAVGTDSLWYDIPIPVDASGGGYSGSGHLMVRGTGGTGPDSLAAMLGRTAMPCGDSTLVTLDGLLDGAPRPLPDSARVTLTVTDSLRSVVSVGGVRGVSMTLPFVALRDSTVYVATQTCDEIDGDIELGLDIEVDAPWADGGVLSTSVSVTLQPPPPPPIEMVVLPDTLYPGQRAQLALTTDLPGDTPLRLGVGAGTVVTFEVSPPAASKRSAQVSATQVTTTVDGIADVWIIANEDIDQTKRFDVNVVVPGGGPTSSARGVVEPLLPAALVVTVSSAVLSPGQSATVSAIAYTADGTPLPPSVLPDSTLFGVASFSGPFGLLSYAGEGRHVLRGLTWGALTRGEVSFAAQSVNAPGCDFQDVAIFVGGFGINGAASVRVNLTPSFDGRDELRRASCSGPQQGWFVEPKISIEEWVIDTCEGFEPDPDPAKREGQINDIYERSLALHIGGGMGWGRIPEYFNRNGTIPLDGYVRWFVDSALNTYPQVSTVLETKRKDGRPVSNNENLRQARRHIAFLAAQRLDHYDDFRINHPNNLIPPIMLGKPILWYVSQNQLEGDAEWEIGNRSFTRPDGSVTPDMQAILLSDANAGDIHLLHSKVYRFGDYRWLVTAAATPFEMVDSPNVIVDWLAARFSLDLDGVEMTTFRYFDLRCDAMSGYPSNRASPPAPGIDP